MIDGKRVLGLVCARGGSKGVARKNLRALGGRPLVAWSIGAAKACALIDRVVVSTEDAEIAQTAEGFGAEVPFLRPAELARDESPEWLVWRHALAEMAARHGFAADYLVVLPPTSPFRDTTDVEGSLQKLHASSADIVISVTDASRNPYFNMVEFDDAGTPALCKRPPKGVIRRQDAPRVCDITTVVYSARADYVHRAGGTWEGAVQAVHIPALRALDIDTEMDLRFAEFLLAEGHVKP
jgi:N-acylneuraminate cytidylyltransferase